MYKLSYLWSDINNDSDNYYQHELCMFHLKLFSLLFLILRENDVAGIDVNMGCPKDYSVKVSHVLHVSTCEVCVQLTILKR